MRSSVRARWRAPRKKTEGGASVHRPQRTNPRADRSLGRRLDRLQALGIMWRHEMQGRGQAMAQPGADAQR